jgi:hypothetical protein
MGLQSFGWENGPWRTAPSGRPLVDGPADGLADSLADGRGNERL